MANISSKKISENNVTFFIPKSNMKTLVLTQQKIHTKSIERSEYNYVALQVSGNSRKEEPETRVYNMFLSYCVRLQSRFSFDENYF